MNKSIALIALGGIIVSVGALVGEVKAHIKYRKGFNDGFKLAVAMYDLRDTVNEIVEKHNSENKD